MATKTEKPKTADYKNNNIMLCTAHKASNIAKNKYIAKSGKNPPAVNETSWLNRDVIGISTIAIKLPINLKAYSLKINYFSIIGS